MRSAIQPYTVRDVEKPLTEIVADVGETSFDGVEFAHRVHEADPTAVRGALDDEAVPRSARATWIFRRSPKSPRRPVPSG